jgi:hypothetical protein
MGYVAERVAEHPLFAADLGGVGGRVGAGSIRDPMWITSRVGHVTY